MYEFTHGIDHIGRNGISPILLLGKGICEQDFVERDLSGIQGIYISQRGLDGGVSWNDLNVEMLGEKFPNLRYLHIDFGDRCDLSGLGEQPCVEDLTLICPRLKQKVDQPQFLNARRVKLQLPTPYFKNLLPYNVEWLELFRPKISDLSELPARRFLSKLRVIYARNLKNLQGVECFANLVEAVFTDCPNLTEVGDGFHDSLIREIWLSGVRRLRSIDGLRYAKFLEKAFVIDSAADLVIPADIRQLVRNRV